MTFLSHSLTTLTEPPWSQFTRPFVRDLAYAIACPVVLNAWTDHEPLLNTPTVSVHDQDFWPRQYHAYRQRLINLDTTTAYQSLTKFLMQRPSPYRLGFHFEGLIHFWLIDGFEHGCHPFEVLAHNVQLFRDKQTVGELDYILRNHDSGDIEHWELAIKFFLGQSPYSFTNWVGMNSWDNLQRKMSHMQSKQFKAVWVDINTDKRVKVDRRVGVIKGRFFKPVTDSDFKHPDWLTPSFPIHDWYDGDDLTQLSSLNSNQLRQAYYVEWFTQRPFYNQPQMSIKRASQPRLDSGLYFEGDRPLVIYHQPPHNKKS